MKNHTYLFAVAIVCLLLTSTHPAMGQEVEEVASSKPTEPDVVATLLAQLESDVARGRSTDGAEQKNDVPVKIWKNKKKK